MSIVFFLFRTTYMKLACKGNLECLVLAWNCLYYMQSETLNINFKKNQCFSLDFMEDP